METKTYTTIDRAAKGWPSGPWDGEPDKVQWEDPDTGMPCLAVRNSHMGNWCGYVGVGPDHPLYKKHYNDVDLRVHGGLTFSNSCQPTNDESRGVCHVPAPGESNDIWWLGFDCSHYYDYGPGQLETGSPYADLLPSTAVYRTLSYVQRECAQLANQLVNHESLSD
jgi:hypothetical protein